MTDTMVQPTYFATPTVTPRIGELLDVATVVEGAKWLPTTGLMETFNCVSTDTIAVIPCPPVTLAAPVQAASGTATTGGTLAAGTYRAVITAVNDRGETVKSNEISQATTGSTSTVTFNWNTVSGATGYRVYITNGAAGSQAGYVVDTASPLIITSYPPAGNVAGTPPTANSATVSASKTFEASSWQDGFQFAAYAGHVCKGIGYDNNSLAELQRVFDANESVAVERALMQQRMVVNGTVWAAATDLTPAGGAVSAKAGLALLEGHSSWNYAGVPTIHAPRSIGSLLTNGGQVVQEGNALRSILGAKVAAGGGYEQPNQGPAGSAAPAGEKWMYASGEVVVVRSEVEAHMEMNRSTNEMFALVERFYVAAVDCYTAAVRVKVE